ncbi:MAG: methionine--tRNA ligase [Acidobacteriota bacterium]
MSFYITCAIDYPNSHPHIGTAYEKIAADMIARYKRLAGEDVHFLMGLDEHSQNVERRAREEDLDPVRFCDRMEEIFRRAWSVVHVEYDGFIRTTEPRHRRAVEAMVARAGAAGDLFPGTYTGWYCVSCEAYYLERDLVEGNCPVHGVKPAWREEENVFFRLSNYRDRLRRHIDEHPEFIRPEVRRNEILALLAEGLEDISVSRSSSGWGIPMPGHPGQAVYVWFDALTNYLSALGFPDRTGLYERFWPADVHLVGKDITRFHAVIWPAMLMSAGVPLPRTIFGHGWVLTSSGRMSKTLGNVMDPIAAAERFGADALRYFLLREVPFGRDMEFDYERLLNRYNADLANDLGNLFQRTLTMASKYRGGKLEELPSSTPSLTGLGEQAAELLLGYQKALERYDLQGGLTAAWRLVAAANLAIDTHKPWELARQKGRDQELDRVLAELVAALRHLAMLIYPAMPERAAAMAAQLGWQQQPAQWRLESFLDPLAAPRVVSPGEPLFPRLARTAADRSVG